LASISSIMESVDAVTAYDIPRMGESPDQDNGRQNTEERWDAEIETGAGLGEALREEQRVTGKEELLTEAKQRVEGKLDFEMTAQEEQRAEMAEAENIWKHFKTIFVAPISPKAIKRSAGFQTKSRGVLAKIRALTEERQKPEIEDKGTADMDMRRHEAKPTALEERPRAEGHRNADLVVEAEKWRAQERQKLEDQPKTEEERQLFEGQYQERQSTIEFEKKKLEDERQRAQEERQLAEQREAEQEQRHKAELEAKKRLDDEKQTAQEERQLAEQREAEQERHKAEHEADNRRLEDKKQRTREERQLAEQREAQQERRHKAELDDQAPGCGCVIM
jgi:hypothetical protein